MPSGFCTGGGVASSAGTCQRTILLSLDQNSLTRRRESVQLCSKSASQRGKRCPFNRGKMAPPKGLAVQAAHAHGCLVRHKMPHKGFSLWRFFPSLHLPAFAGAAGGKMLARAQHPRRMEPTGDFALKRGCVRKSESVPIAKLDACSVRADAPRGRLAAESRALRLDPPAERLWVKCFTRPKSSDIFLGGG